MNRPRRPADPLDSRLPPRRNGRAAARQPLVLSKGLYVLVLWTIRPLGQPHLCYTKKDADCDYRDHHDRNDVTCVTHRDLPLDELPEARLVPR